MGTSAQGMESYFLQMANDEDEYFISATFDHTIIFFY